MAASAAELTLEYGYDDAGRLKKVIAPDLETSYTLDPAGNRSAVTTTTGRGWPSSLTVPSTTSLTGDYTISWGASTGSATNYELYEAADLSFVAETLAYTGTALSKSFTNRPDGAYAYRVRACDGMGCGPRRTSLWGVLVQRPPVPGVPGAMTVPSGDIDGTYTISWIASTGTVTAYELYEATNSGFTGQTLVYGGTAASGGVSGRGNGTYYYRVRACNGPSCSTYRTGANSTLVTLPPSVPGAASVPGSYINTGSYTVTWGASSSGIVTAYELLESIAFGGESLIYSGTNLSFPVSGKANGTYGYRLRACNGPACSAYNATQGNGAVIMVDTVAPTPPTSLSRTGQTNLFWSGGSTDSGGSGAGSGVDRWRVYRSGTLVGTAIAPTQAFNDSAAPSNQTYTYTVRSVDRAGNESAASPPLTVFVDTLSPAAPTGVSAVAVNSQTINISWAAAVDPNGGTVSGYLVYRNGANQQLVSGTSLSDIGLSPLTTYTYTVSAHDSAGNVSPLSAPASATTTAEIPTVPNPPANIGVSRPPGKPAGHPSYTVFWSPSGPPTSYYILDENGTLHNTGSATSKAFNKTSTGSFTYKVKACSPTNVCSGWSSEVSYDVCIGPCN